MGLAFIYKDFSAILSNFGGLPRTVGDKSKVLNSVSSINVLHEIVYGALLQNLS